MHNRRKFIKTSGAALMMVPFATNRSAVAGGIGNKPSDDDLYEFLVSENDNHIPDLLARQEKHEGHKWFGALVDSYGIHTPGGTSHFIRNLATAYTAPESRYYQDADLAKALEMAADYMVNVQHDDGTIDLHTTNFHSPPDTGFVLELLAIAMELLNRFDNNELTVFKKQMQTFIIRAADALTVGGIHTPNHRWVVCMALARVNSLFPNPKYLARIDTWLNEKIDIDPDGQFTEKSSSIYSPLTDRCLITMARLLDKHELLDPVRKNLEMTMYYVHPDGEVVTEASRRQDQYRRGSMAPYYYAYRYMTLLDKNGQYAAMTRWIAQTFKSQLVNQLCHFLEEPELRAELPPETALPDDYFKAFQRSELVRIRKQEVSATVLANNTTFFAFRKGSAALQAVRFASAFFGKGQFRGDELELDGSTIVLRQRLLGPYYQPFPVELLPGDGDWHKMPRAKRPQSEVQYYEAVVKIIQKEKAFKIDISITGTDRVPLAIEMAFRKGGVLNGVEAVTGTDHAYLLRSGYGQYSIEGQTIEFGPGQAEHSWTQLRGAVPKLDADSVYITGFTPFQFTLQIS